MYKNLKKSLKAYILMSASDLTKTALGITITLFFFSFVIHL